MEIVLELTKIVSFSKKIKKKGEIKISAFKRSFYSICKKCRYSSPAPEMLFFGGQGDSFGGEEGRDAATPHKKMEGHSQDFGELLEAQNPDVHELFMDVRNLPQETLH